MKRTLAAGFAAVVGVFALTSHSLAAGAKSNGLTSSRQFPGSKSVPAPHPVAGSARHGVHRRFPVWGIPWPSYYGAPDDVTAGLAETNVAPPELPAMLTCKRSQQAVTVPSWDGGTREVRVTRC
jgi:hypothetical protein